MALYTLLYKVATGPANARRLLTPVGFLVFLGALAVLIGGGVMLDRWLGFPPFLFGAARIAVGVPLIALGVFLTGWSVAAFAGQKGTPVPFNPPPTLVVRGPYAYSRNPMIAGLFLALFGLGCLLGSIGLALIVTPAFVAANLVALKIVEEPELEKRLGPPYLEYRRATPMFLPGFRRVRSRPS